MATVAHVQTETCPIQLKAVYWGPGESGKTTNFHYLRRMYASELASEGFSIETTEGRTLWADSLHLLYRLPLGVTDYLVVIQLVTCTGQERFLATREHVLANADGCVFVGDAEPDRLKENVRSFRELQHFTRQTSRKIPLVVQLNKIDLEPRLTAEDFASTIGLPEELVHEAVAVSGVGVIDTFTDLVERMLVNHFLYTG